jgi:hypothetical protein
MTLEADRTRLLLLGAVVLVGVGLWVFVVQGANRPADPELGASAGAVSPTGSPPGEPDRVPLDGFGEVAITVDPGDGTGLRAWCLLAALDAQQPDLRHGAAALALVAIGVEAQTGEPQQRARELLDRGQRSALRHADARPVGRERDRGRRRRVDDRHDIGRGQAVAGGDALLLGFCELRRSGRDREQRGGEEREQRAADGRHGSILTGFAGSAL